MFIVWVTWEQNRCREGLTLRQITTYLLIHDDVHFGTGFGPALKDSVKAVFFIQLAWPPKI